MLRFDGTTPAAVVIGLDSITGLQTARMLARRGVPVLGLAGRRRHMACRTNACDAIVVCDVSSEGLLSTLDALRSSFRVPPVLFPCSDLAVLMVSRGRDALLSSYRAVLPAPGVVERLLDKASFHAYALQQDLPVVSTCTLRDRGDAVAAAGQLRFPCVLKPAVKTVRWQSHTPFKLFKVSSAGALLARYDECSRWADTLIAQEWIEGPDIGHFTCNAYFDRDSRPRLTFVSQKLRQWPLEGGVGCLSRESRQDAVKATTVRLFQSIGHRGQAYLEMKEDSRTGRLLIVEPNVGRPTGRSAAADRAGVELLYTQYCDAAGLPLPPPREQALRGAKWIYLRHDCQAAFRLWRDGRLGPMEWLRSLSGCRHDAVFSWRDPRPFVADLVSACAKVAIAKRRTGPEAVAAPGVHASETGR